MYKRDTGVCKPCSEFKHKTCINSGKRHPCKMQMIGHATPQATESISSEVTGKQNQANLI